jgi:hypothetical protein
MFKGMKVLDAVDPTQSLYPFSPRDFGQSSIYCSHSSSRISSWNYCRGAFSKFQSEMRLKLRDRTPLHIFHSLDMVYRIIQWLDLPSGISPLQPLNFHIFSFLVRLRIVKTFNYLFVKGNAVFVTILDPKPEMVETPHPLWSWRRLLHAL